MAVYELSGAGSVKTGRTNYTSMNANNQFGAMVPIASVEVVGSASNGIGFSNFPTNVQDLRFVLYSRNTGTNGNMNVYFNGDIGSGNYSATFLRGNGNSPTSTRNSNQNFFTPDLSTNSSDATGIFASVMIDILNWQSSTFKTVIIRTAMDKNGSGDTYIAVGLWRNTSPVTNLTFAPSSNSLAVGTTATLYGIRAVS